MRLRIAEGDAVLTCGILKIIECNNIKLSYKLILYFRLESINFINVALFITEELLKTVRINLGLIGKPQKNFKYLLQTKEKKETEEGELHHPNALSRSRSVSSVSLCKKTFHNAQ